MSDARRENCGNKEKSPYLMTPEQHQQVMDEAYSDKPYLERDYSWRRLYLVDLYGKIRADGLGHDDALNDSIEAIQNIELDAEGKPYLDDFGMGPLSQG